MPTFKDMLKDLNRKFIAAQTPLTKKQLAQQKVTEKAKEIGEQIKKEKKG